jgi:t-SNARE complex subunit (syntaxin)
MCLASATSTLENQLKSCEAMRMMIMKIKTIIIIIIIIIIYPAVVSKL